MMGKNQDLAIPKESSLGMTHALGEAESPIRKEIELVQSHLDLVTVQNADEELKALMVLSRLPTRWNVLYTTVPNG